MVDHLEGQTVGRREGRLGDHSEGPMVDRRADLMEDQMVGHLEGPMVDRRADRLEGLTEDLMEARSKGE